MSIDNENDRSTDHFQMMWSNAFGKLLPIWGAILLAAVVGLMMGLYIGFSIGDVPVAKQPELPSMSQCVADIQAQAPKNLTSFETLRGAREHCYSLINAQGLLNDFQLRKLSFSQQYRANGILLGMVVIVTFSGVILAGLQLRASYQMAAKKKTAARVDGGEISLEYGRLVLKSSVTGLFILLISFGFFLVFVIYVYKFETPLDQGSSMLPSSSAPSIGGLGPPPTKRDGQ